MNKMDWFAQFERLDNEREAGELGEISDDQFNQMIDEALMDELAERADRIHDERKHGDDHDS